MERKLVKQGRNALTVTLPAKWAADKGLHPGDSVQLQERNREIVITTQSAASKKSITVDVTGAERSMLYHVVIGKYIEGYDTITVRHDCPKAAQEVAKFLMGMIVQEHTSTKTVYRSIIAVPEDTFEAVLRRSAHLLVQEARTLLQVASGTATRDDVLRDEDMLDYNLLFCMRYLNKYENKEHAYRYFLLCATLESAGDHLKSIAAHIGKDKKLAENIAKTIEDYTQLLFAGDLRKLYLMLRSFRSSIPMKTFAEGLSYSLAETLYNYLGFMVKEKEIF